MMDKFQDCICDDNLNALIITGEFEPRELQDAWMDIYAESVDICGESDSKLIVSVMRQIVVLDSRITKVRFMVKYLIVQWDQEIVDQLRAMGYRYKFDASRYTEYTRDLKTIITRIKSLEIDLEIAKAEFKAYEDKNNGEPPSRTYFDIAFNRLGRHYRTFLDPKVTSVSRFYLMKKDYAEYVHAFNSKK